MLISFSIIAIAACAGPLTPIYESQRQVTDYIDSGAYLKDFGAVVKEARSYLFAHMSADAAVVLDIDETSLSNWPAYRLNGFARIVEGECDLKKAPCGLRAWQGMARSSGLQPMVDFVREVRANGVKVYFISGRPSELRSATEKNLTEAGYTFDGLIVYPPNAPKYASAVDFKAPERKKLVESGLRVVLCIGDQLSDIEGGYCERGFKLPNPVYYLP